MKKYYINSWLFFLLSLILLSPSSSHANLPDSWTANFPNYDVRPSRLILVDKNKQQLYILNDSFTPKSLLKFICTTGQKVGNKKSEGDLKTPEGVYFIVQHLNNGLDFTLYGNEAYTLNYPNPADRYLQKTGYGIWIHGRGEAIAPLITRGCIAMDNNDLSAIESYLIPGTPVAIGNDVNLQGTTKIDSETAEILHKNVEQWASSWSNRSANFFNFYDAKAYSIAQEDFSKFRSNKERLFKSLPWIKTSVQNIQVLQGPGYWVTWFYQEYEAPNLKTKGTRRLYWHKNAQGKLVILGMEWLPGVKPSTYLAKSVRTPEQEANDLATNTVAEAKNENQQRSPSPYAISNDDADTTIVALAESPNNSVPSLKNLKHHRPEAAIALLESNQYLKNNNSATIKEVIVVEEQPLTNSSKNEVIVAAAASNSINLPPPLPSQNLSVPAEDIKKIKEPSVEAKAEPVIEEIIATSSPSNSSSLTTDELKNEEVDDDIKVQVAEVSEVIKTIEDWRAAWERGDLELYLEFYTLEATQGSRKSAESIKRQKKNLWSSKPPAKVELSDITIEIGDDYAKATMIQKYKDKKGEGDIGLKTLILYKISSMWFIADEQWSPM